MEIQNQTMQHIGREIHDNIGQQLTLASIYSQKFSFENGVSGVNENIENISNIINQSLVDLRQLSKTLTNDTIDQHSIQELIDNECKKINNLKSYAISFIKEPKITLDSYQTKSILLRIVQEFLQNSIKHSKCRNITILLKEIENSILLQLEDDGIGFQADEMISNGIGLSNMKKRTDILNGTFELESKPGFGTKLIITIPL
ncbi:MAG: ATP-binding protein [Flavobacterium sp.]